MNIPVKDTIILTISTLLLRTADERLIWKRPAVWSGSYNDDQIEKVRILDMLLSGYNDGRKKTLFCIAVNLLEIQELRAVLREIECSPDIKTMTLKEKSAFAAGLLQDAASLRGIDLKLHKKSDKKKQS